MVVSDMCVTRMNCVVVLACKGSKCKTQACCFPGQWSLSRKGLDGENVEGGEKKVLLKSCCMSYNSMAGKEMEKRTEIIKKKKNQTGSTATMLRLKWQDSKTGHSC